MFSIQIIVQNVQSLLMFYLKGLSQEFVHANIIDLLFKMSSKGHMCENKIRVKVYSRMLNLLPLKFLYIT